MQNLSNIQNNLEKEEQSRTNHAPWLQTAVMQSKWYGSGTKKGTWMYGGRGDQDVRKKKTTDKLYKTIVFLWINLFLMGVCVNSSGTT